MSSESILKDINYYQNVIQSILISIQNYKHHQIIGANDVNVAMNSMESLFVELSNNTIILKEQSSVNYEKVVSNLANIKKDICNNIKLYGTHCFIDFVNICVQDSHINSFCKTLQFNGVTQIKGSSENTSTLQGKVALLLKYFHPISYKLLTWKKEYKSGHTKSSNYLSNKKVLEKNKIVEDFQIIEYSSQYDCFDLARNSKNFITKVYGIKVAIHQHEMKSTIIVSGIVDDIIINCANSDFLYNKIEELITIASQSIENSEMFDRYISALTLKDLLVYSVNELIHKYEGIITQSLLTKQKPISEVVKNFLNSELYSQRSTLIILLMNLNNLEYQYLAYVLYDLLSNDLNGNIDTTEQMQLFDSLPWRIKGYFKEAMKSTNQYSSALNKFDDNSLPLEQQICLMKANDSVKEKAMNKLKEVKSKSDDTGSKARTYLEGLLKIPFGIYKTEPILHFSNEISDLFKDVVVAVNNYNSSCSLPSTVGTITRCLVSNEGLDSIHNGAVTVTNNDEIIKKMTHDKKLSTTLYVRKSCLQLENILRDYSLLIQELQDKYTAKKREDNIKRISIINTALKTYNLPYAKIKHSGRSINDIHKQIQSLFHQIRINENWESLKYLSDEIQSTQYNDYVSITRKLGKIRDLYNTISIYMDSLDSTLNNAVHGHDLAKRQIKRIIGQWINGESTGYCFGFEGPPGVGKTSFAKKGLAQCLKDETGVCRPFSFIAIGGQDNASSLNGHNYTYVGSEWGKFVDIIIRNKCMNPIIFIDELDKVSKTENGKEIIGILTHLVDSTQNDSFQDKYFNGVDIDLSKALFIFSYNDPSSIDKILLDRIHRIQFEHLTLEDKLVVTRNHILPEICKNMGIHDDIQLSDDNILYIINNYTNEPGIRKFKELLFEIIGEINLCNLCENFESDICRPIKVTNEEIKMKYLKKHHIRKDVVVPIEPTVGTINGLWANSMGQGGIIQIESRKYVSNTLFDLKLTGQQGDVMKESMNVAKTLAISLIDEKELGTIIDRAKETLIQGLHIHCPEGATPKDGPSAGTAITVAIYSILTNKKIKNNVAITGEINLQGKVTEIGGLSQKLIGGIKGGVDTFVFPYDNMKDYLEFKEKYTKVYSSSCDDNFVEVRNIKFIPVHHISDVLEIIFSP